MMKTVSFDKLGWSSPGKLLPGKVYWTQQGRLHFACMHRCDDLLSVALAQGELEPFVQGGIRCMV